PSRRGSSRRSRGAMTTPDRSWLRSWSCVPAAPCRHHPSGSMLELAGHRQRGSDSARPTDADTFFEQELPALRQWPFGSAEARRLRQPVLAVVGEKSEARFQQRQELLLEWLPNVEPFVLAGAGHLLHLQNPSGMADALAAFFARHPLAER